MRFSVRNEVFINNVRSDAIYGNLSTIPEKLDTLYGKGLYNLFKVQYGDSWLLFVRPKKAQIRVAWPSVGRRVAPSRTDGWEISRNSTLASSLSDQPKIEKGDPPLLSEPSHLTFLAHINAHNDTSEFVPIFHEKLKFTLSKISKFNSNLAFMFSTIFAISSGSWDPNSLHGKANI